MMVAPLFAGEAGRKVVILQGTWHNFWTGEPVQGGTENYLPASTVEIPVYVKSGSIVPWADAGLYARAPETRRITARVYGDGSLPFVSGEAKESFRLEWSRGAGQVKGAHDCYTVYAWKRMSRQN